MKVESIEQWNNGYVLKEYKQNAIHKFCSAVKKESEETAVAYFKAIDM